MNRNTIALSFCKTGVQYLNLAEAAASKILLSKNRDHLICDKQFSEKHFARKTKWTDHNLCLPLLFNFYHGLEVLMKGFLLFKSIDGSINTKTTTHDLEKLLYCFKKEFPNSNLLPLFVNYINPDYQPLILSTFFSESNIPANKYSEAFRYPVDLKNNLYNHRLLSGHDKEGLVFFGSLKEDAAAIIKESVKLGRSLQETGV